MLFNTLSTLGFITLAVAAPQLISYERDLASERGLVWAPRSVEPRKNDRKNNNDVIIITRLEETQLTVIEHGREIQLTELVEEKFVEIDQTKRNKDNIRKNHFRNKNSNSNVIIIVVTQIVDIRDSSNINTRYITHQIHSNEEIKEQQIVVVSDAQKLTVGGNSRTGVHKHASPTGTASISSNVATYDPNAVPSVTNGTQILPSGVAAPAFHGTQEDQDPAIIAAENQSAFVSFVGPS